MRHIPEEELHAYLDQALSRSQCVEIESHLAACARCRGLRDQIAALRDRTTALLASLGPEILQPPPFEAIRARRDLQVFERRRWLTRGAWAASVLLSLATGWEADRWLHASPSITPVSLTATAAPPVADAPGVGAVELASAPTQPAPAPETTRAHRKATTVRLASAQAAEAPTPSTVSRPGEAENPGIGWTGTWADFRPEEHLPTLEISSLPRSTASLNLAVGGLWRTILLDGASGDGGSQVARLSGLPVLQVQVQMRGQDREITAVDQQLSTGEMVRTIEGPAAEVADLISRQEGPSSSSATNSLANPRDQATLTLRQGDRMLAVTGPSNVLGSLMNRVNMRRRY